MLTIGAISQPEPKTTAQGIRDIMQISLPEEVDVAAAYITAGGLRNFLEAASDALGPARTVNFRWLTSFDYCRTEPVALRGLLALDNSSVRVFDANYCLSRKCTPRTPFHPKTFFFRNAEHDFVLAGSGNVSRSGLSRGFESGLFLGVDRVAEAVEPSVRNSIDQAREWFDAAWHDAAPLTEELLNRYGKIYESVDNRKSPVPTEDDTASSDTSRGSLDSADLRRLRVCRQFWIEAGNITRNRGPLLPGNQLMMKRLSRVYFGFLPSAVPHNSPIGKIDISYDGGGFNEFSLTYSDNGMDKLVLPIPGAGGPDEYDGKNLLFESVSPGKFKLSMGSNADKKVWFKRSKIVNGAFKMSSGRQWGVF